MAAFVKYEPFVQGLADKLFDLFGTNDVVKAALHSDAPTVATDDELADLSQPTGTGYTAGGEDTQNDATRTGGVVTITMVDVVWTAGASDWGAFRYVAHHDDTSTTDRLMSDHDYGGNITMLAGETFTVDYGASYATIQ